MPVCPAATPHRIGTISYPSICTSLTHQPPETARIPQALRAVRCRHPDGTSRVGHWDAQELARADDRASEDGSRSHSSMSDGGGAGGRRHGRRSAAGGARHHRDRDRDRPRRGEYEYEQDYEYGGRAGHRSRPRGPYRDGYDQEYRWVTSCMDSWLGACAGANGVVVCCVLVSAG